MSINPNSLNNPNSGNDEPVSPEELAIIDDSLLNFVGSGKEMGIDAPQSGVKDTQGNYVSFEATDEVGGDLMNNDQANRVFLEWTGNLEVVEGFDHGAKRKLQWSISYTDPDLDRKVTDSWLPLDRYGKPDILKKRELPDPITSDQPTREQYKIFRDAQDFFLARKLRGPILANEGTFNRYPFELADPNEVNEISETIETLIAALREEGVALDMGESISFMDGERRDIKLGVYGSGQELDGQTLKDDTYSLSIKFAEELDEEAHRFRKEISWSFQPGAEQSEESPCKIIKHFVDEDRPPELVHLTDGRPNNDTCDEVESAVYFIENQPAQRQ